MKVFFCGDIVNTKSTNQFISGDLIKIISSSDLAVANFEAPVKHKDEVAIPKAGPAISQLQETPRILRDAGFQLAGLANNHMFDYGVKGLERTINAIEEAGLDYMGAGLSRKEQYSPKIYAHAGVKIGVLNACETQFGTDNITNSEDKPAYASLFSHNLLNQIKELRKTVDKVILFSHAGLEGYYAPLPEWRQIYKELIDFGVDLIVGAHPHVPQGIEEYGNGLIIYSLGNFYFDYQTEQSSPTYSILLDIDKENIAYDIYYHQVEDGMVQLINNPHDRLKTEYLSTLITDHEYVKNMYSETFEWLYRDYLNLTVNKFRFKNGLIWNLKVLVRTINHRKYKEARSLLLGHIMNNETYRFVLLKGLLKK